MFDVTQRLIYLVRIFVLETIRTITGEGSIISNIEEGINMNKKLYKIVYLNTKVEYIMTISDVKCDLKNKLIVCDGVIFDSVRSIEFLQYVN